MKTTTRRRKTSAERKAEQQAALERAENGKTCQNDVVAVLAFSERGINPDGGTFRVSQTPRQRTARNEIDRTTQDPGPADSPERDKRGDAYQRTGRSISRIV